MLMYERRPYDLMVVFISRYLSTASSSSMGIACECEHLTLFMSLAMVQGFSKLEVAHGRTNSSSLHAMQTLIFVSCAASVKLSVSARRFG